MDIPFKRETTSYHDFITMSDLQWHCAKCELKAAQAKTWQIWRHQGIQLDTDEKGNYYKVQLCSKCNMNTIHRKLKSLKILENTKTRSGISVSLARRIKNCLRNEEAVYLREMSPNELEIDHKFPQIRWKTDESKNDGSMSEEEIKNKFILLTRNNNLLKSRYCEKCFKNGTRGYFPEIKFWYRGNEKWQGEDDNDEKGCVGCFWYDPYRWREELNKFLQMPKNNELHRQ
ncbi:hypothetical protein SHO10_000323 [Campylobacter jejuni]|nr:hypothetical protein [Campylobacter jejuni]